MKNDSSFILLEVDLVKVIVFESAMISCLNFKCMFININLLSRYASSEEIALVLFP